MAKSPFGHDQGTMVNGVWTLNVDDPLLTGGSPADDYDPPNPQTFAALRLVDQVDGTIYKITVESGVVTATQV